MILYVFKQIQIKKINWYIEIFVAEIHHYP